MRFFKFFIILIIFYSGRVFAQTAIDTSMAVNIGGIKQWINISTKDASKPLLLFLSGGPGESDMEYKDYFTKKLREQFVVVIWDQRESGKTVQLNASPELLTIERYQQDTHELITYLLHRFNRPKLYLVGFSWGTVLGIKMAHQYPALLYAYVAVSQLVNQNKSEQLLLQRLKEQATTKNNQTALAELSRIKIPFENKDQVYYQRKWLFSFGNNPVSDAELRKSFDEFPNSMFMLFREASNIDFRKKIRTLQCPIYFFAGRNDYQTNHELTYSYYQKLDAKNKHFCWFEKSEHTVPYTEPDFFQQTIIEKVLPETFK
ncbi:alpha/beta fold hydrolase [Flavobacterium maritimum]|uniref:alpha/beta fold hydrolase n=1 Tax=Flavobacterium maritimum TaxID=3149042 RepID=UPI0032B35D24